MTPLQSSNYSFDQFLTNISKLLTWVLARLSRPGVAAEEVFRTAAGLLRTSFRVPILQCVITDHSRWLS